MKTSCISHPPNAPLIVVHQWQVDMLNGDTTAAKLMSFFEYWHNVKFSIAQSEDGFIDRKDLIQHHSEPELEYGLLVDTSRKSIRAAIKKLYAIGVITPEQNPYNPHDRTRHVLFHPHKAQTLANRWNEIYSRHREEFGCKNPICIPENLNRLALGQSADCNRQKEFMQSANLPRPSGQMTSSIRPNDLDPKTSSKTSSKTSLNYPLPPKGKSEEKNGQCVLDIEMPTEAIAHSLSEQPQPSKLTTRDKKSDAPLFSDRLKKLAEIYNRIIEERRLGSSWGKWSWEVTSPAREKLVKRFFSYCGSRQLDPFEVWETGLLYGIENVQWAKSPRSGKHSPDTFMRTTSDWAFSWYGAAIASDWQPKSSAQKQAESYSRMPKALQAMYAKQMQELQAKGVTFSGNNHAG